MTGIDPISESQSYVRLGKLTWNAILWQKTTNVMDHIEAKHLEGRVECRLCHQSFSTTSYLKKHIKHNHGHHKPLLSDSYL